MNLSYEDIIEDIKIAEANYKVALKTSTKDGFIIIKKYPKAIIAIDHNGEEVAKTYNLSESGLNWLKAECRGWGGWARLSWKLIKL